MTKDTRTLVSPPPGFASRVMDRVQTYKHVRAKWRARLVIGVMAIALVGLLALLGLEIWLQFEELAMLSGNMMSLFIVAASFADQAFTLVDALWLSVMAIASSVSSTLLVAYVGSAVVLTALWLRVAFGPLPYPLKLSWRIEQ